MVWFNLLHWKKTIFIGVQVLDNISEFKGLVIKAHIPALLTNWRFRYLVLLRIFEKAKNLLPRHILPALSFSILLFFFQCCFICGSFRRHFKRWGWALKGFVTAFLTNDIKLGWDILLILTEHNFLAFLLCHLRWLFFHQSWVGHWWVWKYLIRKLFDPWHILISQIKFFCWFALFSMI